MNDRRHPLLDDPGADDPIPFMYLPFSPLPEMVRSQTRKRTEANRASLGMGVHPATRTRLLVSPEPETCRGCTYATRVAASSKWVWKCMRHRLGMSHSEASDIRISWPACTLFRPVDDRTPCPDTDSIIYTDRCIRGTGNRPLIDGGRFVTCPTCHGTGWLLDGRAWDAPPPGETLPVDGDA